MHVLVGRRRIHAAAWSLVGLTLVVLAATLVFVGLNSGEMTGGRILLYAAAALAVIGYAVIGGLIALRVPGNVIGWLLCLVGLTVAASMFSEQYSLFGLATSPGSVPAVKYVGALAGGLTVLAVIQLVVLVLVFPDGHLLSRRWRPVLWGMCLALAGGAGRQFQSGTFVQGGMSNALAAAGVAYREPVHGLLPRHGWFSALLAIVAVVAIASVVLTIASVFARRRRGTAEVRQQLAWLAYLGALTVIWIAVLPVEGLILGTGDTVAGTVIWGLMILTPVAGIPVACAVAVLRYRLYDLDVVVKKTVVAGLVAAAFTAIYALVVVGVGAATGGSDKSVLTFAAAAIAAMVLQPARARAGWSPTGWSTASARRPTKCCRTSPGRSRERTRQRMCCRAWPGWSPRLPAPSGQRCACAPMASSGWRRPGRLFLPARAPMPRRIARHGRQKRKARTRAAAPGHFRWSIAARSWGPCASPARCASL